ncbi:MAG: hypothetical protein EBZ61_09390 [Micrococcales bacterium]|nr:hypothetical protein [Micrococcales bacterium]
MSEENKQEPQLLQVFDLATGKQFSSNAVKGVDPQFTVQAKPVSCTNYAPGHNFHWIPLFRFSQPRIPIQAKWFSGNQFEVFVEGNTAMWFHHDPERLKEALSKASAAGVQATEGRPCIFVDTGDGAYAFNCSEEPIEACQEVK